MSNTTITSPTRESWWTRTVNQLTGPSQSKPAVAPGDRVSLSGQQQPAREEIRSQASRLWGGLKDAVTHPSQTLESLGKGGSRLLQGAADFAGKGVALGSQALGTVEGALTRGGARVAAKGLDLVGAPQAAERVRRTGDTAAKVIERGAGQAGETASNFISGIGDGAGSMVEGVGTAVAHPI